VKKFALMAMVFVLLASPAVAWEGERSSLISEEELADIERIAQKAYPRGSVVRMDVLGDDWLGACTTVQFTTGKDDQVILLNIFPSVSYARVVGAGSEKIDKISGGIIAERVGEVFNKRPAQVVEQLFE